MRFFSFFVSNVRVVRATLRVYEKEPAIYRRDTAVSSPSPTHVDLLSSLSQLVTLPFQSQVCLSKSKASPLGHVICFRPDLVHLVGPEQRNKKGACVSRGREKDVIHAYSPADRSSSRSSSSRRSAARCRTRDPSGTSPSPTWSPRSRWLCRT